MNRAYSIDLKPFIDKYPTWDMLYLLRKSLEFKLNYLIIKKSIKLKLAIIISTLFNKNNKI